MEHTDACRSTGVLFIEWSVVVLKMNVSASNFELGVMCHEISLILQLINGVVDFV